MSIISKLEIDNSSALAKRFAELIAGYLDDPKAAKARAARVPLENVFRMLEMYRYNAYSDEDRRGILALDLDHAGRPRGAANWHIQISLAFDTAFAESFSDSSSKNEAIDTLQSGLRRLATEGRLPDRDAQTVRKFMTHFGAKLA